MMSAETYFMLQNAFDDMQCLICHKTFKKTKKYNLKKHFEDVHKDMNYLQGEEKEKEFKIYKKIFIEKLKEWVNQSKENDEDMVEENLKMGLSNLISLDIVKKGRPFSDGPFVKNILSKVFAKLHYKTNFIEKLPLSRNSITRRSLYLGAIVESAIREKLKNCEFFSFCIDESTDINNLCQLVICIRCVDSDYNVFESIYSVETFYGNVTGKLLFDVVNEKLLSVVDSNKLAGVCTDGASTMTGKRKGFVGQMNKNEIEVYTFHCIIHQAALASKFISKHPVMKATERIINRIRGGHNSLTHRKFVTFLKNSNAPHHDLLMFTEVRWLSRGNSINRLFELRNEVFEFLEAENIEITEKEYLKDYQLILDMAFLTDICNILNELNLKLQGKDNNISDMFKILSDFRTQLFLLAAQIDSEDFSDFPKTSVIYDNEKIFKKFELLEILETLFNNFNDRFKDFENIQHLLDIFQNPFKCDILKYEFPIQTELIILRSELDFPDNFSNIEFWKNLDGTIYPEIKKISLKCLSLFPSTYLCEQIFSDLNYICSKKRNKLNSSSLRNILLLRNCNKSINIEDFITF